VKIIIINAKSGTAKIKNVVAPVTFASSGTLGQVEKLGGFYNTYSLDKSHGMLLQFFLCAYQISHPHESQPRPIGQRLVPGLVCVVSSELPNVEPVL
jgi:hypothetical protein